MNTNSDRQKSISMWRTTKSLSLLLLLLPIAGIFLGHLWQQAAVGTPYRYHFARSSSGEITLSLGREIGFYQQRIRQNPGGGMDRASLAGTYLKMARASGDVSWYLLAEQSAQQSLTKLSFHNDGAILALAKVAEARHDFAQAIELVQKVSGNEDALGMTVTANLAMGRVDKANKAADTLKNRLPTVGSLTLHALVKVAQGNQTAALQDFQQAIAIEEPGETGSSVWARTLLGRLYYQQGQLKQAEGLYQEALRILPQYPPALLNLAQLEIRLGRYQAAEELYLQFFQLAQKSPTIYDHVVFRGMACVKDLQGDGQAAIQWRDRAQARLREDLVGFGHRRELAQLLLESDRPGGVAEALTLMQAEVRNRRDAETLATLALALSRSGRWQAAQQVMNEARRWGIRDPGIFEQAGTIEQKLGNISQANQFFGLAQAVDPQFNAQAQKAVGLGVGLGVN